MSTKEQLLEEIEQALRDKGLSATEFGELACRDRHLVRRLRNGCDLTTARLDEVRAFIRSNRIKRRTRRRSPAPDGVAA